MKYTKRLVLSCALLALPFGSALAANVYKWIDENGTVHYADQKPGSLQAQQINIKTSTGTQPEVSVDAALEQLQREQEVQALARKQSEEAAKEAEHRQKACEAARANLEVLQNNARVRIDENGTQRYLTPEEMLNRRDQYQAAIRDNC